MTYDYNKKEAQNIYDQVERNKEVCKKYDHCICGPDIHTIDIRKE